MLAISLFFLSLSLSLSLSPSYLCPNVIQHNCYCYLETFPKQLCLCAWYFTRYNIWDTLKFDIQISKKCMTFAESQPRCIYSIVRYLDTKFRNYYV